MSRGRRVGGSGWAGLHGSFIGIAKKARSWKSGAKAKKPKIKKVAPGFNGHMTFAEARHAGLTRQQWQKQANDHVARVEQEMVATRQKLASLREELKLAERARQAAFEVKATAVRPKVEGPAE